MDVEVKEYRIAYTVGDPAGEHETKYFDELLTQAEATQRAERMNKADDRPGLRGAVISTLYFVAKVEAPIADPPAPAAQPKVYVHFALTSPDMDYMNPNPELMCGAQLPHPFFHLVDGPHNLAGLRRQVDLEKDNPDRVPFCPTCARLLNAMGASQPGAKLWHRLERGGERHEGYGTMALCAERIMKARYLTALPFDENLYTCLGCQEYVDDGDDYDPDVVVVDAMPEPQSGKEGGE